MISFKSRWDSWEPAKTPIQCTDRTDKSGTGVRLEASVSNVSSSDRDIPAKSALATPLGHIAKSRLPPETLNAEDWCSFFTERSALLEHDGGLSSEKADRLAFESCVAALTWVWPTDYPQDTCAACGSHLAPSAGLPLADKAVVCNHDCHIRHMQQQRERAKRQLADIGITGLLG